MHFRSFLCLTKYWYMYIYFRTKYMKFVWIGCMSDHVCILQNNDIYIISEQITWNLYELVACQVIFVSSNIMMCIYIIFKPNEMKFVWIGCMSDHLCMVKNHDIKIYIYIFNIRTTGNMPFLLIWVPPICLVSRFRGSITHAFPQMGVVLISKAN